MIVVDCSVVMAGTFSDEESVFADHVLQQLAANSLQAIVPVMFYLESANVLLMAYQKHRIDKKTWQYYLETLAFLPLEVDNAAAQTTSLSTLSLLADQYQLTTYDAAYLELAKRRKIPLATLDKKLHMAAAKLGFAYS